MEKIDTGTDIGRDSKQPASVSAKKLSGHGQRHMGLAGPVLGSALWRRVEMVREFVASFSVKS